MGTLDSETKSRRKYPEYCRVLRFIVENSGADGTEKEMVFPKALDLDRPKRSRTNFTRRQLEQLESVYQKHAYLVGVARQALATTLNLTETQVKVWFQNRRTKAKRELDCSALIQSKKDSPEGVVSSGEGAACSVKSPPLLLQHDVTLVQNNSLECRSMPISAAETFWALRENWTHCYPYPR